MEMFEEGEEEATDPVEPVGLGMDALLLDLSRRTQAAMARQETRREAVTDGQVRNIVYCPPCTHTP